MGPVWFASSCLALQNRVFLAVGASKTHQFFAAIRPYPIPLGTLPASSIGYKSRKAVGSGGTDSVAFERWSARSRGLVKDEGSHCRIEVDVDLQKQSVFALGGVSGRYVNHEQKRVATAESFIDLLEGRTPLIHEAGFISRETCSKLEAALEPDFTPYLHAIGPQLDKVGVAQFEFQAQSEDDVKTRSGNEKKQYFQAVRELGDLHGKLADKVGLNVFAKAMTLIRSLVPADWEVALATEDSEDEQYFAGIIRGINNGTPIHCDWAPYDTRTEPWAISRVTHQAVFNLCLAPPVKGGGTLIHDVQWSPEALAYRDPNGYGYFDGLVEGRKKAPFQPHAGDLYFFNSRNMHQVLPVAPGCNKRRMAMASFFGVLPPLKEGEKTKLVFWS